VRPVRVTATTKDVLRLELTIGVLDPERHPSRPKAVRANAPVRSVRDGHGEYVVAVRATVLMVWTLAGLQLAVGVGHAVAAAARARNLVDAGRNGVDLRAALAHEIPRALFAGQGYTSHVNTPSVLAMPRAVSSSVGAFYVPIVSQYRDV
jgi:hypothetical protein